MKALNYQEVTNIVETLNKKLSGARLQKLSSLSNGVVLEFYNLGKLYSLYVDLGKVPFVYIEPDKLKKMKQQVKPIEVFLKSHFISSICQAITQPDPLERRVQIHFSDNRVIEIQLAPHAKNISAFANAKSIHFKKPVELSQPPSDYTPDKVRTYDELYAEFKTFSKPKVQPSIKKGAEKQKKKIKQDIEKHQRQLSSYQEMKAYIESFQGDWSKKAQEVPESLKPYWDFESPVYNNYEKANEKIKALEVKHQRAVMQLDKPLKPSKTPQKQVYKNIDVATRKLELESGVLAFIGKSAKDNLLLLRNAKPWFLWMHLKDLPGSHVIVVKNKNQKISENDLHVVAKWLLSQQFQNKKHKMGEKFDVIYTECRYVKPIKGNKTGLVNYQNEKSLTVKFE